MKVLSLAQPFAWGLIAFGMDCVPYYYKTQVRGPVLVHAPRLPVPRDERVPTEFRSDWDFLVAGWLERYGTNLPYRSSYRRMVDLSGGILGATEIVDCVSKPDSPWARGPWGLVLQNTRPLPFTKCSGIAGIWDLPEQVFQNFGLDL